MIIDNIHKMRWICDFLCWIGRHDFEFKQVEGRVGILYCFYCGQLKRSGAMPTVEVRDPWSEWFKKS